MASHAKELALAFFTSLKAGNKHRCKCGEIRKQYVKRSRNTNLASHVRKRQNNHDKSEYGAFIHKRASPMCTFFKVSDAAMNLYGWLDWIVNENRELAFCKKPRARKYSRLQPVCRSTLKKYLRGLHECVEDAIVEELCGKRVGFEFDSWSDGSTHNTANFAVTSEETTGQKRMLLAFTPNNDEEKLHSGALLELFDLDVPAPVKRNDTRWSSTFMMLQRYLLYMGEYKHNVKTPKQDSHTPSTAMP
ncbi:TPA: hypothetical protein N0F65_012602 [Lagenidium giganteum]|uniref:Transposase n=1 Tax=Lagenidium giganteum TaxID=4803 RepID=A0AAV2YQ43_9STRA|nr:TPA: hypothetical protein N0F65_012602 [Lagenidium giganteum]